jgi:uncharacterized peroxidase-related enzyme
MSYLSTISDADGPDEVRRMYDADRERLGYVANYTRTFSPRPEVYAAWQRLNGSIKAGMDARRYEVATLAAARRLKSSYCALAHGKVLAEEHVGEQAVRDLMDDAAETELEPIDLAVARLAAKVAGDAPGITESDFTELRALGLVDTEILDIVFAAGARCFFSTVLDATGTQPDHAFVSVFEDGTRKALAVGRPISDR